MLTAKQARRIAMEEYPPFTMTEILTKVFECAKGGKFEHVFYHSVREWPKSSTEQLEELGYCVVPGTTFDEVSIIISWKVDKHTQP